MPDYASPCFMRHKFVIPSDEKTGREIAYFKINAVGNMPLASP